MEYHSADIYACFVEQLPHGFCFLRHYQQPFVLYNGAGHEQIGSGDFLENGIPVGALVRPDELDAPLPFPFCGHVHLFVVHVAKIMQIGKTTNFFAVFIFFNGGTYNA